MKSRGIITAAIAGVRGGGMTDLDAITDFIRESNRIENIHREPTDEEVAEFLRFMGLPEITISDLEAFINVYQPSAILRDRPGLDVRVGNHYPPGGGAQIRAELQKLLWGAMTTNAWQTHIQYETLHPFTDGNGRSGRMLWAWQVRDISLGFLHLFYYQTLGESRHD